MAELVHHRLGLPTDDDLLIEKITIPVTKAMLRRIQDFRFGKRYSSQSDAVRDLIEAGLRELAPAPTPFRKNSN